MPGLEVELPFLIFNVGCDSFRGIFGAVSCIFGARSGEFTLTLSGAIRLLLISPLHATRIAKDAADPTLMRKSWSAISRVSS